MNAFEPEMVVRFRKANLAADFNEVFYRRTQRGDSVPEAFRAAAVELRERYDASSWSNLMLLGAGEEIGTVSSIWGQKPSRRD